MLELNCRWFVETYSDYRDGGLGIAAQTAVHAHMASCEPCRRYDRVIRTGVSVLREEEAPARRRNVRLIPLRNRAWAMEQREYMALGSAGSGIATLGVALVAVVLGSFAWLPLVGAGSFAAATPEFEMAPVVAAAPESPVPARPAVGLRPTRATDDVIWPPLLVHGSSWFTGPNTPGLAVEVDPD